MFNHTTWLISKMDPIKYIFEKPALTRRIARWQKLRRTQPDMAVKIKEEVGKQIDVGFLVTSEYPQWVPNIILFRRKMERSAGRGRISAHGSVCQAFCSTFRPGGKTSLF